MSDYLVLILFAIFLLVLIALHIAMFISLGKQGDERRKAIVGKASANAFAVTVLYLLYCVAENIFLVVTRKNLSPDGMNPFIVLSVIAIIYAVFIVYYKKKYGD